VLFLVASGFVMAQTVTAEWAQAADGKPVIKFTNKNADAQSVQYTVKGDKPGSIDIPANTEVILPYTLKNPNQPIDPPVVKPVAKPKALPKGATSAPVGGAPAPAAGGKAAAPAPAPAAGGKAAAPAPAKK
jgi:hypothetical protein